MLLYRPGFQWYCEFIARPSPVSIHSQFILLREQGELHPNSDATRYAKRRRSNA